MRPRLEPDWAEGVFRAIERKVKRHKRTPLNVRMIRNYQRRKAMFKKLQVSEQTTTPTTQARRPRKGLA